MTITAHFYHRNLADQTEIIQAPLTFTVQKYSWAGMGGPKQATIVATGTEEDLANLVNYLRCPVAIYDDQEIVWWGYVNQIDLNLSKFSITASLDDMYNNVAVAYEQIGAGSSVGTRQTTAYNSDPTSVAEYGTKSALETSTGTTGTHANADRDRILSEQKYPILGFPTKNTSGVSSVTFTCNGWWKTLEWQYYASPLMLAAMWANMTPAADYLIGKTSGASKAAQEIIPNVSNINAARVDLYMAKVGNPVDNVVIGIYSDPDGKTPTTQLASATVAGSTLSTSYGWVAVTFGAPYALTPGSKYFIQVSRSGGGDDTNYYKLAPQMYYMGDRHFVGYASSTWTIITSEVIPWRIYSNNLVETSAQCVSMVQSAQFINGCNLAINSGISTESYRDGDGDILTEVEDLLKAGTTNSRRMLASVDRLRTVSIFEEDDGSKPWRMDTDFTLYDFYGNVAKKSKCPVGMYIVSKNFLAVNQMPNLLVLPSTFFVEEMEYNVATDELSTTSRGTQTAWDVIANPRRG